MIALAAIVLLASIGRVPLVPTAAAYQHTLEAAIEHGRHAGAGSHGDFGTGIDWQAAALAPLLAADRSDPQGRIQDDATGLTPLWTSQFLISDELNLPGDPSLLHPTHCVAECARRSMRTSGRHPPA